MRNRIIVIAVVLLTFGLLAGPAGASHEMEPAAVACGGNGVCEVGNGIALTPPEASAQTVAFVADMFPTEVGRHVPSLIGPIPD